MTSDIPNSLVPEKVLAASIGKRVHFFDKRAFVAHSVIENVLKEIRLLLQYPGESSLVLVYGPTGAGKTTVRQKLCRSFQSLSIKYPDKYSGRILVAGVDLDGDEDTVFNWKSNYYIPALESLREPLINEKIEYAPSYYDEQGKFLILGNAKKADLRHVLISTLRKRSPKFFWLDNAHNLTKTGNNDKLNNHMNSVMNLADKTHVPHILLGTYDMLSMVALKSEIARRSINIHLRRYDKLDKRDQEDFRDALATLQLYIPVEQPPDLVKYEGYFFEQSLGCIGILKDRLTKALHRALHQGAKTLLPEHWISLEKPDWELRRMDQQIREGEEHLLLKLNDLEKSPKDDKQLDKKQSRRPGEQNPKRYLVG